MIVANAFYWQGEEVEGFERICTGLDELSNQYYNLVIPTALGNIYVPEDRWVFKAENGEIHCFTNQELGKFLKQFGKVKVALQESITTAVNQNRIEE